MVEIRWTEEAQRWLRDIYDYIAADNPDAARKVVTEIYDKVQILEAHPAIGYRYRAETEGEIRILLYGHYRIAYLITGNSHHRYPGRLSWRTRYRQMLPLIQ